MKKLFLALLIFSVVVCRVDAQSSSVTLQVTDAGGQTWNNGTWSVLLVSQPGATNFGPPFNLTTGGSVPNQSQSGALNGIGGATITLSQNSFITPTQSKWQFTVCPAQGIPSQCYTQSVTIAGASPTVTLSPPAISVSCESNVSAYTDGEVICGVGGQYYNLTSTSNKQCTAVTGSVCTTWIVAGSSFSNQYPLSRPYLRNTQAQLARLGQGVSNNVLTIIFGPGDSWMSNQFWSRPFSQWMWAQWQMSGSGYLSIAGANIPTFTGPQVPGCTVTPTGTWVYSNATSANFGPDLTDSVSSDIATPATQTLTCAGSNTGATIYWLQQPSGGSFTWAVDGGGATTISTAGTLALGTTTISGLSQTLPHTIVLTVTVAGSGVDIFGADWQNSLQPGIHIVNLGDPGTRASTWNGANQTIFQAEIASLNPNLFITEFGGNELSGNVDPATFTTNLNQVVTNMRAAAPNADCLMQSQSDVSIPGHLYTMDQYANAMQTAALASGCAFVNTFINFPSYTVGNSLGLYSSASHLGQSGGEDMARLTKAIITNGIQYSTFSQGAIGQNNLFVGPNAGTVANTGVGTGNYLNSGYSNTVMGIGAGTALTTGYQNSFYGFAAGKVATTSCCNALFGYNAGQALTTTGQKNTFIGWGVGQIATTAVDNVGVGYNVFSALTTGANSNVAVGESACNAVATVNANTCIGHQSLVSTTGGFNSALGYQAGNVNTSGTLNTYVGFQSGKTGVNNLTYSTCIGADCVTSASNTITFGRSQETTLHPGPANFQNTITTTNCSSSASPAVCGSSVAGSVAVPTGTNPTLVVNTTAVTANSQIFLNADESLGTKLGITCNSTLTSLAVEPVVTARTAATSFTIQISGVISTNAVCLSYFIIN